MDTQEVKLLSMASNSIVVQAPYRRFPGVIIQGDTLDSWYCILDECKKCIELSDIKEASECISELQSFIRGHLVHYESVLKENGIGLPYGVTIAER